MRYLLTSFAALFLFAFSSCRKDNYYYPQPQPNYQMVTYSDDYNNDDGNWGFSDNADDASGYVSNGTYKMFYDGVASEAYYISKDIDFNTNKDFTIQTRIGSDNNMGLLFGYQGVGVYGYSFTVDYNGNFALYDEGGNGFGSDVQEVVQLSSGNFVNNNGDWNDLRIEQRGNKWYGYINDVQVFNIDAQPLYGTNVGYVLVSNTAGEADYIQVDYWPY